MHAALRGTFSVVLRRMRPMAATGMGSLPMLSLVKGPYRMSLLTVNLLKRVETWVTHPTPVDLFFVMVVLKGSRVEEEEVVLAIRTISSLQADTWAMISLAAIEPPNIRENRASEIWEGRNGNDKGKRNNSSKKIRESKGG